MHIFTKLYYVSNIAVGFASLYGLLTNKLNHNLLLAFLGWGIGYLIANSLSKLNKKEPETPL